MENNNNQSQSIDNKDQDQDKDSNDNDIRPNSQSIIREQPNPNHHNNNNIMSKLSIESLNSIEVTKSRIDKQNNIQIADSQLDFVSIDNLHLNINKPEDRIFDDTCSVCSRTIFYTKFICAICPQCTLCEICEESHLHPVIKFKQSELSSLEDIVHYIKENQMKAEHPTRFFDTLFKDKYIFHLDSMSQSFTMRRNKEMKLPISIENTMNCEVTQTEISLVLIAKNMKDLMIRIFPIKNSFGRKEKYTSVIDIRTGDVPKLYDFTLELYSSTKVVLEANKLNIKIEVNDDEEDEELNGFYKDYGQLMFLTKEKKGKIKEIVLKKTGIDNPILIKNILEENGWSVEGALKQIISIEKGI